MAHKSGIQTKQPQKPKSSTHRTDQIKNYFTHLPDKSVEKRKISSPEDTGPVPPVPPGACNSKSFFDDIN